MAKKLNRGPQTACCISSHLARTCPSTHTHGDLLDDEQVNLLHEFCCGILFGDVMDQLFLDVDRDLQCGWVVGLSSGVAAFCMRKQNILPLPPFTYCITLLYTSLSLCSTFRVSSFSGYLCVNLPLRQLGMMFKGGGGGGGGGK